MLRVRLAQDASETRAESAGCFLSESEECCYSTVKTWHLPKLPPKICCWYPTACCARTGATTLVGSRLPTPFTQSEPSTSVTAKHPIYHRLRTPSGSRRSASLSAEPRGTRQVASGADRPLRRSDWPGRKK